MTQTKVRYKGKIYRVTKETEDRFCIVTYWGKEGDRLYPLETKNVSKAECEELF